MANIMINNKMKEVSKREKNNNIEEIDFPL
jgi:hypothetical protein